MRKYGYLVVEGPHDVEFCYRLLKPFALERVQFKTPSKKHSEKQSLDEFFHNLIPTKYPLNDGDIQKRMPIPLFFQNKTHTIAIHSAIGDSRLIETIQENISMLNNWQELIGVGVILDSDKQILPIDRYNKIKEKQVKILPEFNFCEPSKINKGKPNLGIFILPDNQNQGTLEDLLLESAKQVYPDLLDLAKKYVSDSKSCKLKKDELKELSKPAGENKAIIGAMANIMRPGKSVQVSIQDNRWVDINAINSIPQIKAVQNFLKELFEL
jgi:hypothetical protein